MSAQDPDVGNTAPREARTCTYCRNEGWMSMYSTPHNGVMFDLWNPCPIHGDRTWPDRIDKRRGEGRPIEGVDFVLVATTCAGGRPAINDVCGSLECACTPMLCPGSTRLHHTNGDDAEALLFAHDEDDGRTIVTLDAHNMGGRMQRSPRADLRLCAPPAFPKEA